MATYPYSLALVKNGTPTDFQSLKWEYVHLDESVLEDGFGTGSSDSGYIYDAISPPVIYHATDVGGFLKVVDDAGDYGVFYPSAGTLIEVHYELLQVSIAEQVCCGIFTVDDEDYMELTFTDVPGDLSIEDLKIVRIGIEYS